MHRGGGASRLPPPVTKKRHHIGEELPSFLPINNAELIYGFLPPPRLSSDASEERRAHSANPRDDGCKGSMGGLEGEEDEEETMEITQQQSPLRRVSSRLDSFKLVSDDDSSVAVASDVTAAARISSSLAARAKSTTPHNLTAEEEENLVLSSRLKRVKISKQTPGQLRLAKDVMSCRRDPKFTDILTLAIDKGEGRTVSVNECFVVSVGKYYPHAPPVVLTSPGGIPVCLPVLSAWNPTFSLREVLYELIASASSPPPLPPSNSTSSVNSVDTML